MFHLNRFLLFALNEAPPVGVYSQYQKETYYKH